jgi:hypothetical protein
MKSGLLKLVRLFYPVCFWRELCRSLKQQQSIQRQGNQRQRIDQGIRSGELTRHEVKRLEREQTHTSGMM